VGITFSRISTSSWTIKPWFLTERKACCYIYHTLLLGFSNWPVTYSASSPPSAIAEASQSALMDSADT
jgi:hypothetical protein